MLRTYPWNFAEVWAELGITTAPAFGYTNAYTRAADDLRLLMVIDGRASNFSSDPLPTRRDFRLMTQGAPDYRKVIALDNNDASTLQIIYTADISLMSMWDPLAVEVFAIQLALNASKSITGQDGLGEFLNELLTEAWKDASGVDGQEQSINLYEESPTRSARNAAGSGDWFTPVSYS